MHLVAVAGQGKEGRFPEAFEVDFKERIEFQRADFQQWPAGGGTAQVNAQR